jgi:hypothetical protein
MPTADRNVSRFRSLPGRRRRNDGTQQKHFSALMFFEVAVGRTSFFSVDGGKMVWWGTYYELPADHVQRWILGRASGRFG